MTSDAAFPKREYLPLRLRNIVLALLSTSIAINLVDRQALSVVAPVMRAALHFSNTDYAYIVCAFQVGMFIGQAPAGAIMDRIGTRLGLALAFIAWSFVSAAHAAAGSLLVFIALRFLMGLSECGNYTGGIKAIASLYPPEQRAFSGGIFNAGAQLGAVLAPPLIVWITVKMGWRMAFVLPSLLSLIWLVPWLRVYPKDRTPAQQGPGGAADIRIFDLARNQKVFGLFLLRLFSGPLVSFYWYWLPEYLRNGRQMSFVMIGLLAWLPYVFGTLGNLAGGWVSDRLAVRLPLDRARKLGFTIGLGLAALSMTLPLMHKDWMAIAIICLVVFGNNWIAATYIATIGEMFPSSVVGRVNGIAGAGDSGAGVVTMLLTGIVVDRWSYFPVLIAAGVLPILALASIFIFVRKFELVPLDTIKRAA
ncbi:MAG TPA: MFS transporter [Bryobacteraceae bacterium]|nr:MFS transporter [Bryobacteraceae bacterium]